VTQNSQYELVLVYSNLNQQSLRVRVAINEFISENLGRIDMSVREIEFERDKAEASSLGVLGTPATLLFRDGELVRRHLGELTVKELKAMIGS